MATETSRSSKPPSHPPPGKALFEVDTPEGRKPFVPPDPSPPSTDTTALPDNPDNPRGRPSLSLPQQATPLTSQQGTYPPEDLLAPQTDPQLQTRLMAQNGLTPDNPLNPRGTPDFIVGGEQPPPTSPSPEEQGHGQKDQNPQP